MWKRTDYLEVVFPQFNLWPNFFVIVVQIATKLFLHQMAQLLAEKLSLQTDSRFSKIVYLYTIAVYRLTLDVWYKL